MSFTCVLSQYQSGYHMDELSSSPQPYVEGSVSMSYTPGSIVNYGIYKCLDTLSL